MTSLLVFVTIVIGAVTADSRFSGGLETTIEKYPYAVQIEYMMVRPRLWEQECAGTILNALYILSSAHCFDGTFYHRHLRRIRAGTTYRNVGGLVVYIVREFNHPSYDLRTLDGDISVILLASPLIMSPVIQPALIPRQGSVVPDNYPVTMVGWGHTADDRPTRVMLELPVYTVNRAVCNERHFWVQSSRNITENMICAGVLDVAGLGPCRRAFGGPLVLGNVVVGVISWTRGCAWARFPEVNANVASYTDWIVERAG